MYMTEVLLGDRIFVKLFTAERTSCVIMDSEERLWCDDNVFLLLIYFVRESEI